MPEEPSILDFLKSRLRFWDHGEKIRIPDETDSLLEEIPAVPAVAEEKLALLEEIPAAEREPAQERPARHTLLPWRSFLALLLALAAQRAWEPSPNRTALFGLILYAFSLALLIWAAIRREWTLTPLPMMSQGADSLRVRGLPLALGTISALAAFLTLGHNLFTVLNVTLWVIAIGGFVWAFWIPENKLGSAWNRFRAFLNGDSWQIKVSRWALLILVLVGIIAFFRIYNLPGVPSEPNSDHAEKLLDVFDVSQGQTHIFFPRNTGREAIQMYLTLVVSWIFHSGISFISLKIGTVICGLVTLPYLYLLGKEFGSKRIGLMAVFFAGIAYWPNVISRFGLRFPLYPLFVAPTLYYLIRGLRTRHRNDFILSGLFLGFGLHGYTPFRIVPFIVVIAVGLYILHTQSVGNRRQALLWLVILAVVSFIVFLPLARYWLDYPDVFSARAFSRLGTTESPLPGPAWMIFLSNTWNALRMFNWNDGETWANSVTYRPAFDVVSGALFILGIALVLVRYIRSRHWLDLFLLLSLPLLELPSILSLAFPNENPILSRTGAAFIPAFLIIALALDGLVTAIQNKLNRRAGIVLASFVLFFLGVWSMAQNYDLVFHQYADQYTASTWNSSEMGAVIKQFGQVYRTTESVWIVAYPYWVDTRLPGVWAGIPNRDFAVWPQDFQTTLSVKGPKLFMIKPEDTADLGTLQQLYPQGVLSTFHSAENSQGKDFLILFVSSSK